MPGIEPIKRPSINNVPISTENRRLRKRTFREKQKRKTKNKTISIIWFLLLSGFHSFSWSVMKWFLLKSGPENGWFSQILDAVSPSTSGTCWTYRPFDVLREIFSINILHLALSDFYCAHLWENPWERTFDFFSFNWIRLPNHTSICGSMSMNLSFVISRWCCNFQ